MDMNERLPTMSDAELTNLLANAERLQQSGTERQQIQAGRLMPLLTAEIEARKVAKLASMKEKRAKKVSEKKEIAARAAATEKRGAAA